ncbi:gag-pol protein [Lasius niger]|uniref:Gag-pol protein n=1 Tax=Lasius niger TaxID=67767 RepID=A0A0J7K815_LASNI|nr:gag-pol protein [Lasius niger]
MGIRAAHKEDINSTAAELVFGEPIRLPGQFLQEQERMPQGDTSDFVEQLHKTMQELRPRLKRHGQPATFIFKDMNTTTHVFLRHDAPTGTLQPPYDGPYEVLNRGEKTFKIRVNGKTTNVSIDRLKPAYTLNKEEEDKATQESTNKKTATIPHTKNGRQIKPPVRFQAA